MGIQQSALPDKALFEILKDAEESFDRKLSGIRSSVGLMDFIIDMSSMWEKMSIPLLGKDNLNEDKGKLFIYKNMMKFCKLELARRRLLLEAKGEEQYLASLIRINRFLTDKEVKIVI